MAEDVQYGVKRVGGDYKDFFVEKVFVYHVLQCLRRHYGAAPLGDKLNKQLDSFKKLLGMIQDMALLHRKLVKQALYIGEDYFNFKGFSIINYLDQLQGYRQTPEEKKFYYDNLHYERQKMWRDRRSRKFEEIFIKVQETQRDIQDMTDARRIQELGEIWDDSQEIESLIREIFDSSIVLPELGDIFRRINSKEVGKSEGLKELQACHMKWRSVIDPQSDPEPEPRHHSSFLENLKEKARFLLSKVS